MKVEYATPSSKQKTYQNLQKIPSLHSSDLDTLIARTYIVWEKRKEYGLVHLLVLSTNICTIFEIMLKRTFCSKSCNVTFQSLNAQIRKYTSQ